LPCPAGPSPASWPGTSGYAQGHRVPGQPARSARAVGGPGTLARQTRSGRPPLTAISARFSKPSYVLWAALGGMIATTFPVTVFTLALPQLEHEFNASLNAVTWVLTAPPLAAALALPVMGRMSDIFGHRRVFLAGSIGAGLTAFLVAVAPSLPLLITFRTIGQVCGSATTPASLAMIAAVYPAERRLRIMGYWSLAAAGSPVVGLIVGGPLIDAFGWRSIFIVQGCLIVVARGYAWLVLPRMTPTRRTQLDVRGLTALAVALGAGLTALELFPQPSARPWAIAAAVLSAVGFVAFFRVEKTAPSPVLPLDMLRVRNFSAPIVAQGSASFVYQAGYILTPLMLELEFGLSAARASLILVLRTGFFCVGAQVPSRIRGLTPRGSAMIGTAVMAAALPVFAASAWLSALALVVVGNILAGYGNGMSSPSLTTSVVNAVPEDRRATATGLQQMMGQVGAVIAITVSGAIVAAGHGPGRFSVAFLVALVPAFLSLAAAGLIQAQPPPSPDAAEDASASLQKADDQS
jgi:MFS family permease